MTDAAMWHLAVQYQPELIAAHMDRWGTSSGHQVQVSLKLRPSSTCCSEGCSLLATSVRTPCTAYLFSYCCSCTGHTASMACNKRLQGGD